MAKQQWRVLLAVVLLGIGSSCATPATQVGTVSPADPHAEQLKRDQLIIQSDLRDQQRLEDIGFPLLKAARPMCGGAATDTRVGFSYANVHTFSRQYRPAARAMGFTDSLTVVSVTRGSAAESVGVKVGDRIMRVAATGITPGRKAIKQAAEALERARNREADLVLILRHGAPPSVSPAGVPETLPVVSAAVPVSITLPLDTLCNYTLTVVKHDMPNAWIDGQHVFVTSAMLRFASTDDELATLLAHQISHNAMRHMEARAKNHSLGALFGAVLDVTAQRYGVYSAGEHRKNWSERTAGPFSQDFEREADYVGMYILARANRPFASASDLWRRLAQASPGSINFTVSHPTTEERYLRLDEAAAEIRRKQASQSPLLPEKRNKK